MDFNRITTPVRMPMLVSFMDITGFAALARSVEDPLDILRLLDGWAGVVAGQVEAEGGLVVKFLGDACLVVFDEAEADPGVRALLAAKAAGEARLAAAGHAGRVQVTVHVGEVAIGPFGPASRRALDVFGDTVNTAATLGRGEHKGRLVISPQAFRRLEPGTRRLFHRHTPPVVYIAEE